MKEREPQKPITAELLEALKNARNLLQLIEQNPQHIESQYAEETVSEMQDVIERAEKDPNTNKTTMIDGLLALQCLEAERARVAVRRGKANATDEFSFRIASAIVARLTGYTDRNKWMQEMRKATPEIICHRCKIKKPAIYYGEVSTAGHGLCLCDVCAQELDLLTPDNHIKAIEYHKYFSSLQQK